MKIEHVAMYVNDLETARDFFVKYLGGRSNDGYHNIVNDISFCLMAFTISLRI